MKWLLRPSTLVLVLVALAFAAAVLALWPRLPVNRALPLGLEQGDQEVVWLYPATNAAPWERFVSAIALAKNGSSREGGDIEFDVDDHNAFPDQTTAIAEVAVRPRGSKGKIWFRWYKITSDLKTPDWVESLLTRRPPPLAIIGGSTSDLAIDLARSLRQQSERQDLGDHAPLLLLTQATADAAETEQGRSEMALNALYPGHTFRFCFTNKQMAEAVT